MKCKICGHRTNTINMMRVHYIKKHPSKMKRHTQKRVASTKKSVISKIKTLLNDL